MRLRDSAAYIPSCHQDNLKFGMTLPSPLLVPGRKCAGISFTFHASSSAGCYGVLLEYSAASPHFVPVYNKRRFQEAPLDVLPRYALS